MAKKLNKLTYQHKAIITRIHDTLLTGDIIPCSSCWIPFKYFYKNDMWVECAEIIFSNSDWLEDFGLISQSESVMFINVSNFITVSYTVNWKDESFRLSWAIQKVRHFNGSHYRIQYDFSVLQRSYMQFLYSYATRNYSFFKLKSKPKPIKF